MVHDRSDDADGANVDALLDVITGLFGPLLNALDGMSFVARKLHPPYVADLAQALTEPEQALQAALEPFRAAPWPDHLQDFRRQVLDTADVTVRGLAGLRAAAQDDNPIMGAYKSLGYLNRGLELLYPLAPNLPPVSRFFLTPERRDEAALLERLSAATPREDTGVFHFRNEPTERGGFSLYVPEYYDGVTPMPLVLALHGGSGHGRSFLWSWLADARTQGVIVLSPTSRDRTWSLMGQDIDSPALKEMVTQVCANWRVDPQRILLSGMSDGGTFSYLAGLMDDVPYTHLAPTSASFHPLLLEGFSTARMRDLPVYLTHGALDWMFPVDVARMAQQSLGAAGARVEYREIEDLSHTFPRDENPRVLRWLLDQPLDPALD